MPRSYYYLNDPRDETIERLRRELSDTRLLIISLMPDEIEDVLQSFLSCQSRDERRHWPDVAADRISELAKPIPEKSPFYFGERAYCPLCGGGSSWGGYESGFALPAGMRRHLLGWGSNRKRQVMEAAIELARDHWRERFHESDMAEEQRERELEEERRRTETLYQTAPDQTKLINEGIGYQAAPRDEGGMAWAEERLAGLGFEAKTEGNVKSYTDEREDLIVYADLRSPKEISFRVYRKSFTKGKTPRVKYKYLISFSLPDGWKHDLRSKYESRLPLTVMAK